MLKPAGADSLYWIKPYIERAGKPLSRFLEVSEAHGPRTAPPASARALAALPSNASDDRELFASSVRAGPPPQTTCGLFDQSTGETRSKHRQAAIAFGPGERPSEVAR